MSPDRDSKVPQQRNVLVYINPFWPATGACGLRGSFSPDYVEELTAFLQAFEKTVTLSMLYMSNMKRHYAEAFQRLALSGRGDAQLKVFIASLEGNKDDEHTCGTSYRQRHYSEKLYFDQCSVTPLNGANMLRAYKSGRINIEELEKQLHTFLPIYAELQREVSAVVYCIHTVKTTESVDKEGANNFHKRAYQYLEHVLSHFVQRVDTFLQRCPLLIDAYIAKMYCITVLRQLQSLSRPFTNNYLVELFEIATLGIENCSILLALYDTVTCREFSSASASSSSTECSAHLVHPSSNIRCLRYGLLMNWYTLRAYKTNILRQLGKIEAAYAEVRVLMSLTTAPAQASSRESPDICACLNTSLTSSSASQATTYPQTTMPITAQQSNFVSLHSRCSHGFMRIFPLLSYDSDESDQSDIYSSQENGIYSMVAKLPSLTDVYPRSHLSRQPHDCANVEDNSKMPQLTDERSGNTTGSKDPRSNAISSQKNTVSAEQTTDAAPQKETDSNDEDKLFSLSGSQSFDDSTVNAMGCAQHGMQSFHLDYRLVYILTALAAGHESEVLEYLKTGVFRTNLFNSLQRNLNYECSDIELGKIMPPNRKVIDTNGCDDSSMTQSMIYYRSTFEQPDPNTIYSDAYIKELADTYLAATVKLSQRRTSIRKIYSSNTNKHRLHVSMSTNLSAKCFQYKAHNFITQHQKVMTSIIFQRAYKYVNYVASTIKNNQMCDKASHQKTLTSRLKPSMNFLHYLKGATDPGLFLIISEYLEGHIHGPLSRILFYGPYYKFKYTADESQAGVDDTGEVTDIMSSSTTRFEGVLQAQIICFNFSELEQSKRPSSATLYPVIDAPAPSFFCLQQLISSSDLTRAQLPIGLQTTPLTTITVVYTLLLLILRHRVAWANRLAHALFSGHILGCACIVPSLLFNKRSRVIDVATAWPNTCIHVKFIPPMLQTDLSTRPAIPSLRLIQTAFSNNPYVVEYLLCKAVLPSKEVLHCLTVLFNIYPGATPDDILDVLTTDESTQFHMYKEAMMTWSTKCANYIKGQTSGFALERLNQAQSESEKLARRRESARLRLSQKCTALFHLVKDQQRLEAAVYVSEFGELWGSDTLFQEIHALAQHLASANGVMAGLPFTFYITALRIITSGTVQEHVTGLFPTSAQPVSSFGYLQIAQLDFLLQAYMQYLQYEMAATLKNITLQPTKYKISHSPQSAAEVFDAGFLNNWMLIQRANIISFNGYPSYNFLQSARMMKGLFYNQVFKHRHVDSPNHPGLTHFANPLTWMLNLDSQYLDLVSLASLTADKPSLLSLLHTYLTLFTSGDRKDLFSTALIDSQHSKICLDSFPLVTLFSRILRVFLVKNHGFSPGKFLLELTHSYVLSNYGTTNGTNGIVYHSINDLTCLFISTLNKAHGQALQSILLGLAIGTQCCEHDSQSFVSLTTAARQAAQTLCTQRDTYRALQNSDQDTVAEWFDEKVPKTPKSSPASSSLHDPRAKWKPSHHPKSSNHQRKRSVTRIPDYKPIPALDDPLFTTLYIDDKDPIYEATTLNPGIALRFARTQRTQEFGLVTLDNTLQLEDIIERLFAFTNYSVSDFINKFLVSSSQDTEALTSDWSYIYSTEKMATLSYSPLSSFNIPLIYYVVAKGSDEAFTLLMERILAAVAYRRYLDQCASLPQSDTLLSPEEFCGYAFVQAEDELIDVSSYEQQGTVAGDRDTTSPLFTYISARQKARLGRVSKGCHDLSWFVAPSPSVCRGSYKMVIYEAQANILDIPITRAEIDTLYTVKSMTQQQIDICINPLWVNTVGSTGALLNSISNMAKCQFNGETLLHIATKRDHLHMIGLIMLLLPLDVKDMLRSFYTALLNHSSGALRYFLISSLWTSFRDTQTSNNLDKVLPFTFCTEDPEESAFLRSVMTEVSTVSSLSDAAYNIYLSPVHPLLEGHSEASPLSMLLSQQPLRERLQEFQTLVSSNLYYVFLSWAHLIRTLRPLCAFGLGSVLCLNCYATRLTNHKQNSVCKHQSLYQKQLSNEKGSFGSVLDQLFAQQCYFSGHTLQGCISLLLSANIGIYVVSLQNMRLFTKLATLSRMHVMQRLPIKQNEQKGAISYPDHLVLLKYLSAVYQKLGLQSLENGNLNSVIFDHFTTPLSTPLIMAAQFGSPVCYMLCAAIKAAQDSRTDSRIHSTYKTFKEYLDHRDAFGLTALHHATILFVRSLLSILRNYIQPTLSLCVDCTASSSTVCTPRKVIFDSDFAYSLLAVSRANIKALLAAGSDPEIPDVSGVRCTDRFIAALLDLGIINFPKCYNLQRFTEQQPTDTLVHLILWSERFKKPERTEIKLLSETAISIRMSILTKEAKRTVWRDELMMDLLEKLRESGHLNTNDTSATPVSNYAIDLQLNMNLGLHTKIATAVPTMNTIIQSNFTRITSEISIILHNYLNLPAYQNRSVAYPAKGSVCTYPPVPTPADILPLPFCNVDEEGIPQYLKLWVPLQKKAQADIQIDAPDTLLWAYGLYSVYGLRECHFIGEFRERWAQSEDTFIPWSADMYTGQYSAVPADHPNQVVPRPSGLLFTLQNLAVENTDSRLAIGESRIHYRCHKKTGKGTEICRYHAAVRFRNYVWRKLAIGADCVQLNVANTSRDDYLPYSSGIFQSNSAIVDTITVSVQHAALQSPLLVLSHSKPSNCEVLDAIARSMELSANSSVEINRETEHTLELSRRPGYQKLLSPFTTADDTALVTLRLIFRRARTLSILADGVSPRSTLVFCTPDDMFFLPAYRLSSCLGPERRRYYPLTCVTNSCSCVVPDDVPIEFCLNYVPPSHLIDSPPPAKLLNIMSYGTCRRPTADADDPEHNRMKHTISPFTPKMIGFSKPTKEQYRRSRTSTFMSYT